MSQSNIVAIHQPNFFPWLGYFDKIVRADAFVFLDNVQYPKKGGSWVNRVQAVVSAKPQWLTANVERSYHGVRLINDMRIDDHLPWRSKLLKTLAMSYNKAPFFKDVYPLITKLIQNNTDSLCECNIASILSMCSFIGIDASHFIRASALKTNGSATDMLISIVKSAGGDAYLCGGGADGYQEDSKFEEAGVELIYQEYQHPIYEQFNMKEFVKGMSIIDVLMNCGPSGTAELLSVK